MAGRRTTVPGVIKRLTANQFGALVELWRAAEDGIYVSGSAFQREQLSRLHAYGYATKDGSKSATGTGKRFHFKITTTGRFRLLEPMKLLNNDVAA